MARKKKSRPGPPTPSSAAVDYHALLGELTEILSTARRAAARSVNALITATYWEIGRRIVEVEQSGGGRAEYGQALLKRLAADLTKEFGRGFSERNLRSMRLFYQKWPIRQTLSAKSSGQENPPLVSSAPPSFPLPWSHYIALLAVKSDDARRFYEEEAIRGGWSIRQLKRQINSQFYERTLLSRSKAAMLAKGQQAQPEDALSPEEEIKDPFVLEFLDLKDEYSETDLEEALIHKLESFLLELGGDFAFIGRQRRLRIDDHWYRVDLLCRSPRPDRNR